MSTTSSPLCCGIDFGTSNSTIGLMQNSKPSLISLEQNKVEMPTALFYSFDESEFLFGREAIEYYIDGEYGRFMRALKSTLGTSIMNHTTQIQARDYSFVDLIHVYLKQLKKKAETVAQADVNHVVLGRPVHFVDEYPENDREAQGQLESAAQLAGFKHIEFQYEPIAAALDFEQTIERETLVLIADIGGGTSDFTVIRLSPNKSELDRSTDILATTGIHIGGTDIDRTLNLNEAMPLFGYKSTFTDVDMQLPTHYFHSLATWHLINFLYAGDAEKDFMAFAKRMAEPKMANRFLKMLQDKLGHYISFQVEQTKIQLSHQGCYGIELGAIEDGLSKLVEKDMFEGLILSDAERVQLTARDCIRKAGLKVEDIGALFLTGGTTSIPLLHRLLTDVCPQATVVEGDKFGSVGTGLVLQAGRVFR